MLERASKVGGEFRDEEKAAESKSPKKEKVKAKTSRPVSDKKKNLFDFSKSQFLTITKGKHAARPVKTKRWLLRLIRAIYDSKIKADHSNERVGSPILELPDYIYSEYIPSNYGVKNLVDQMCWDIYKTSLHLCETE
eukprot:818619_1